MKKEISQIVDFIASFEDIILQALTPNFFFFCTIFPILEYCVFQGSITNNSMGLHPSREQQEKALASTLVHILSQVSAIVFAIIFEFQLTTVDLFIS